MRMHHPSFLFKMSVRRAVRLPSAAQYFGQEDRKTHPAAEVRPICPLYTKVSEISGREEKKL